MTVGAAGSPYVKVHIDRMAFTAADQPLMSNLHFEVPKQHIVGLIGASGIGKTTLLRVIAGYETAYAGYVEVDGRRVTGPARERQVVFQDTRLFPWLTAMQNVAFACPTELGAERFAKARHWLARVGLEHRMNAWPGQLSGGEKSRVALARALIDPPKVLLLDEPLAGLDISSRLSIISLINEFRHEIGFSVILVSHEIYDSALLADSILILAARPMRIQETINVDLTHPRKLQEDRVAVVANAAREALIKTL